MTAMADGSAARGAPPGGAVGGAFASADPMASTMTRILRFALLVVALSAPLAGARAQEEDISDLLVRLNKMEGQVRSLSGQVEQLQFDNRQLKDNLRKFQEDVEFRFQDKGGRGAAPATTPSATPSATGRPGRRSDAYDPGTAPEAPGAPRNLGAAPATPGRAGGRDGIAAIIDERGGAPADLSAAARSGNPDALPRATPSTATGSADPRSDYDAAYAYVLNKQYDQAEMALRRFLQSHPRDKLVPDATFWLGESYLQRNRAREAAEQFLKVSTDYTRAAKAPDALLKLGVSLAALGAKDQACATFAELERKYPAASPAVKQGADREQKRARCPA
jgi:tol-pal system protein YbgF